jgi:hypothetical protein
MRIAHTRRALTALAATLLLGACAGGNVGDILGGPAGRAPNQIQGIVRAVDVRNGECRVELDNTRGSSSYLANGGAGYGNGGRATIFCDSQTRVVFQGQTFRPESLENGDEVIAQVSDVRGRLVADRIDVTYDVSGNDRYGNDRGNDRYGTGTTPAPSDDRYDRYGRVGNEDARGTVRRVDRNERSVTLERVQYFDRTFDRGGSDQITLYYDTDTRVTFRGQSYRPESLEPGDIVAVSIDQVRGALVANSIEVLADASETAAYPR